MCDINLLTFVHEIQTYSTQLRAFTSGLNHAILFFLSYIEKKKCKVAMYNEWRGYVFSNNVMLEEPSIHRPSFDDFSITFFQQIGILPVVVILNGPIHR
jgi:hypothetical protein